MALFSRLRDPFAAGTMRARNKPFLAAAMASAAFVASIRLRAPPDHVLTPVGAAPGV